MVKTLLTKSLIVVSLTYAVEEKAADLIKEDASKGRGDDTVF